MKNVGMVLGAIAISLTVNAQSSKVTSAAIEYQKAEPLLYQKKFSEAQPYLEAAKGFIDEASEWYTQNPGEKNEDKMHLYRGKIYGGLVMLEASKGEAADETKAEKYLETSLNALKVGYSTGKKYKTDIKEYAERSAGQMNMGAGMLYEAKNYADAGEAYGLASRYLSTVGVLDSGTVFNAGLCYETAEKFEEAAGYYEQLAAVNYRGAKGAVRAAFCYKQIKEYDKALAIINKARETYPSDKDLLTQLVNIRLDQGDDAGAKQALDDAISADPNNPALHYIIGTIYMNLKNNEEAEKSLRKSLELDPNYVNAQYQLGAHLYNWALKLKDEASFLGVNEKAKEKELLDEADVKMLGAIEALEKYIEAEPNDKAVLDILYKAYHKQGDTEKAKEYKARRDAL